MPFQELGRMLQVGYCKMLEWVRMSDAQGRGAFGVTEPNAEGCRDFKGWIRTRDGRRRDPLAITDPSSRYSLETRISEPPVARATPVFEAVFRARGLPEAIHGEDEPPFVSLGAGGFTWFRAAAGARIFHP